MARGNNEGEVRNDEEPPAGNSTLQSVSPATDLHLWGDHHRARYFLIIARTGNSSNPRSHDFRRGAPETPVFHIYDEISVEPGGSSSHESGISETVPGRERGWAWRKRRRFGTLGKAVEFRLQRLRKVPMVVTILARPAAAGVGMLKAYVGESGGRVQSRTGRKPNRCVNAPECLPPPARRRVPGCNPSPSC